jgi:hypothetical protein
LGTGLGALAVYRLTLLPGLGAWDTAEAQAVLPAMGTMHPTGFPAYVVLGWLTTHALAPLGSPAFIANLLSALLVSLSVGLTVLVMRRLGATLPVAVAVAIGFALTPIVWAIAVAADAHALHLALVVAVVALLLRWEAMSGAARAAPEIHARRRDADRTLVAAAAVFGIALANHALSLLLVPAIGLFVLAVEPRVLLRPRLVLAALGACLGVAALLYLELPLRAGPFRAPLVYGHPETWDGFWDIVLARQFQGNLGLLSDLPARLGQLVERGFTQLGPLAALVPLGLLVVALRQPRYALLSGLAVLITCVFAASYTNAAIERYYLVPVFFAWTWLGAIPAAIVARVRSPSRDAGPAGTGDAADDDPHAPGPWSRPVVLLGLALGVVLLVPTAIELGERWRTADQSGQRWAAGWLDEAFGAMERDAVVVSWWSYSTPMWYGQVVEGRRSDILVADDRTRLDRSMGDVDDVIETYLGRRPVYLIRVSDAEIAQLGQRYVIERAGGPGNLYRVTGRQETSP